MKRPLPPLLGTPAPSLMSPSTPTHSTAVQTGRPPIWTKSAQRKMTRLYVYTTLPLNKILEVVYANSPESAPGPDSANKKLNALLDKEPRWLHPRTETDMGRRLTQLSNSSSRLNAAAESSKYRTGHSPSLQLSPSDVKSASATSPSIMELPTYSKSASSPPFIRSLSDESMAGLSTSITLQGGGNAGYEEEEALYPFLRSTTFMSTSTSDSTGSFHRILAGYSDSYILAVKRLVRRFTAPGIDFHSDSPGSDRASSQLPCFDDDDMPTAFQVHPFPLPGDFLSLDLSKRPQDCVSVSSEHALRRCMCAARTDVTSSPWVAADGVTADGQRLLMGDIATADIGVRDAFDNTILHFLAARGSMSTLFRALRTGLCAATVNSRNTAGQTLVHVLGSVWVQNFDHLCRLLDMLASMGFDIYAVDHYGRNVIRTLHVADASASDLNRILQHCDVRLCNRRDAFGVKPMQEVLPEGGDSSNLMDMDRPLDDLRPSMSPKSMADPAVVKEAQLLRYIRLAHDQPHLEDAEGRNGLHCLAMATLSMKGVVERCNLSSPTASERPGRRSRDPDHKPDSSKDRLNLRLGLLTGLLDAGVDPNHYDSSGTTPLMAFAAQLPEDDDYKLGPQILELLIRRGANIHARSRTGETGLHVAIRCGRKLAMKTLVNKSANVYARDAGGRSVLDVADVKVLGCGDGEPREYAHYEACRAWLSGKGMAVQEPSVEEEWGVA